MNSFDTDVRDREAFTSTRRTSARVATKPAPFFWFRAVALVFAAAALVLTLSACSEKGADTGTGTDGDAKGQATPVEGVPTVATASYALAYVVEQVGGDEVNVEDLSSTAGHAHNLELSPAQVQRISKADLIVYLSQGFQPAVEEAISQSKVPAVDALGSISEDDLIAGDPHVWLDPMLVAQIGHEVADALSEADPAEADYYHKNADDLAARLQEVEDAYDEALADCKGETRLTRHEAFGYMAKRYELDQVGVTGVDPEAEPSPARIRELQKLVDESGVTTIFVEPLASAHHESHMTESLNVPSLPLDTVEVQVDEDEDLIDVYWANLDSLKEGLACAK